MPRVYFQFDKFNIEKDISNIDKLVGFFGNYPSSKLIITGHTDNRGSKKYNIDLGLQRANAVKGALVKAGIKPEQIEVSTMGMSEPSVDCSRGCSEAQHAMNRVAIIQLLAK
jgi:outer membrane protein OmpA-like peptidoglycan-associated protein